MTDLYVQTDDTEWDGANYVRAFNPASHSEILSAALNLEGVETVDFVGGVFKPGRYAIIPLPPEADE